MQIIDGPPPGVTVTGVSLTLRRSGAATWPRTHAPCRTSRSADSAEMVVTVVVDDTTTGTITNNARTSSDDADPDGDNNSTSEDTTIDPVADISVAKTTLDAPVVAGESVTYRIRVSNAGPSTATLVNVVEHARPVAHARDRIADAGNVPWDRSHQL